MEEFDRGVFESIIEKVIVGGYDEDGNKDPYKITFIYKTGLTNGIENAKMRFGSTTDRRKPINELCPYIVDEVKDLYSNNSLNTCGSCYIAAKEK